MNAHHTPGPWGTFIPEQRTNKSSEHRLLVTQPDGSRIIAHCDVGYSLAGKTTPRAELIANVHLIRSAPDMLAALRAAQLELEANKVAMIGPEWAAQRTMTGGALLQVSKAIALAEGLL